MANRLKSGTFIILALLLMGWAMIPIVRAAIGIDEQIGGSFIWSLSFMIGGLMCGLTGMLLMVRKQPPIAKYLHDSQQPSDKTNAALMHASGMLIAVGIPLLNFLVCYYLWVSNRAKSKTLDTHGREAICFQISIYLYLLMCLFMAFIIIGAFAVPSIVLLLVAASIFAVFAALDGKVFRYPANINIIDRFLDSSDRTEQATKTTTIR